MPLDNRLNIFDFINNRTIASSLNIQGFFEDMLTTTAAQARFIS